MYSTVKRSLTKAQIIRQLTVLLITTSSASLALAEGGGGGGGVGGEGASGPEPQAWMLMLTGALVLAGIAFIKSRAKRRV